MECSGIKDLLSEYIDGVLDPQTKARVDRHLETCEACNEDLASMKALVHGLGSLTTLKAPDDFLEKLHERMEPRMSFKKVMRALFIPGRIKIPLELATAAVVGVLIFFAINIQQSEKMMSQIQERAVDVEISKDTSMHKAETKPINRAYKSAPVMESAGVSETAKRREVIQLALLLPKEKTQATYELKEDEDETVAAGKGETRARSARLSASSSRKKATPLGKEDKVMESAIEEAPTHKPKSVSQAPDGSRTLSEVKNIVHLVNGQVISIEYEKQTEHPKSLRAEIPAKDYLSFTEKLRHIAPFQSPPPTLPTASPERIEVRITFMSMQ